MLHPGESSHHTTPPSGGPQLALQPTVAFSADNLRRNLWENIRLFAEEVAEAAAQGKEKGPEQEALTKLTDTVNSLQLCLFLLREPYLSPTQVWLGYNQCKVSDRVNFKLSDIGKEYDSPEETKEEPAPVKSSKRQKRSPAPPSPSSSSSTVSDHSRLGTRAHKRKSAQAPASNTRDRGQANDTTETAAPAKKRTRSGSTPPPDEVQAKLPQELGVSLGNEVDSEDDREVSPRCQLATTSSDHTHLIRQQLELQQLLALHQLQQEKHRHQLQQHSVLHHSGLASLLAQVEKMTGSADSSDAQEARARAERQNRITDILN